MQAAMIELGGMGANMDPDTTLASGGERSSGETGDACAMVIFGASGDLTKRKLSRRFTTWPRRTCSPENSH